MGLARPAAILLVILMVSDVAENTWVIHKYGGEAWMVINQWIFLIFVLLTIGFVWRATPE
jgi:DMSO/TMAO reductase YedYZ heme-binding membrane subunit